MMFRVLIILISTLNLANALNLENRINIEKVAKVAANIDAANIAVFKSNNFELPDITDDSVYLRRVFLVFCGRIPSLEETESFLNWKEPDKRELILPQLLQSEDYEHHKLNWYRDLFRIKTMSGERATLTGMTNNQKQLNFSYDLPSPANASHPMNLFGHSDRIEVNNYNKSANLSQALEVLNGSIPKYISYNANASINNSYCKG